MVRFLILFCLLATAANATTIEQVPVDSNWFLSGSIERPGDRAFVGDASLNTGANGTQTADWLSAFNNAIGSFTGNGVIGFANFAATNGANPNDWVGVVGAAHTLHFTSPTPGAVALGVVGYGVNDNTTLATNAWAFYGECHQVTSNGGQCIGMEVDARAVVAGNNSDPFVQGSTVDHQVACGAGITSTGHPCGTGIQIVANPETWECGICFMNGSVTPGAGPSSSTKAIGMPAGYAIVWFNSAGIAAGGINIDSSGNVNIVGSKLVFNGTQVTVP